MAEGAAPPAGSPERIPCILNVAAGTAAAVLDAVERDPRFALRHSEPEGIQGALVAAMEAGPARIAVAGGDGTVATAAGVLAGTGVELAVIPAGTLNHFARSLEIPTVVADALDQAVVAESRLVDVGYANDRLFLNTGSVGAYVNFVQERERLRERWGYHLASLTAAARILRRLPAHTVAVTSGGEHRRYSTPLVFVQVREREVVGDPPGDQVNGGLRLVVVLDRRRRRLTQLALVAAIRGLDTASRTPVMESLFVDGCTIAMPGPRTLVALDGETVHMSTPIRFRVEPQALQVVAARPGNVPGS